MIATQMLVQEMQEYGKFEGCMIAGNVDEVTLWSYKLIHYIREWIEWKHG